MRCLVILPTYNERDNLPAIIQSIEQYAPAAHVLIVDDNSPDGTGALADELSLKQPDRIFVIHREQKEGLGPAYIAGFKFALGRDYDVVVQMDADLSHDPKYLPLFFDEISNADVVIGSRYLQGISVINWDLKRLILSQAATFYVRTMTGLPLTDATTGFKCWRRNALAAIDSIVFVERRLGRSKFDWRIIAEGFWRVIRMRLRR